MIISETPIMIKINNKRILCFEFKENDKTCGYMPITEFAKHYIPKEK